MRAFCKILTIYFNVQCTNKEKKDRQTDRQTDSVLMIEISLYMNNTWPTNKTSNCVISSAGKSY